jgi:hypothetical protein
MTSDTTTTILFHKFGREGFRLTPTAWEIAAALIVFAFVVTMVGVTVWRRRR